MLFIKHPELEARVWYRTLILFRYAAYGLALLVLFGGLFSALTTGDKEAVLGALGSTLILIVWWGVEKVVLYLFLGPTFSSKALWNKALLFSCLGGGLGIFISAVGISLVFQEKVVTEKPFSVRVINMQTKKIEFVDPFFLKPAINEGKYALIKSELYQIKRDYPYNDIIYLSGDGAVREIQSGGIFSSDFADSSSIYDFKSRQRDKEDVKRFAKALLVGMVLGLSAYLRGKKSKPVSVAETTSRIELS